MDSIFYSGTDQETPIGSQYQTLAFIIWLSALIIMSVLFNNMLVYNRAFILTTVCGDIYICNKSIELQPVLHDINFTCQLLSVRGSVVRALVTRLNQRGN